MRTLLSFQLPVARANQAIKDGSLPKTLEKVMALVKPEAAYFTTVDGKRTGLVFFDLSESSDIPVIAEPLFQDLDATVSFTPVMTGQELAKGLAKAFGG